MVQPSDTVAMVATEIVVEADVDGGGCGRQGGSCSGCSCNR